MTYVIYDIKFIKYYNINSVYTLCIFKIIIVIIMHSLCIYIYIHNVY